MRSGSLQLDTESRLRLELRGALPSRWFSASSKPRPRPSRAVCASPQAFKNFGDGLLDYMEAGPKLRKWYGEGERRPRDGQDPDPEEEEEQPQGPADAILVTDGDSQTGELVILQLILARLKVTALVKDPVATKAAYGDYVTPVQGRVGDAQSLYSALRTARAVVCPTATGALPEMLAQRRLGHVVLLSSVGTGQAGFFSKLLGSEQAMLSDPAREEGLKACNSPLTVVRVGRLVDVPGGAEELTVSQGEGSPVGDVSREDVAQVLVRALTRPPKGSLTFTVASRRSGQRTDWSGLFSDVNEASTA